MKIAVLVAMEKELKQLREAYAEADVKVVQCGIGKVNAALMTERMILEYHPEVLISTGCAGGHGAGVNIRDIVVSTELAYHDVYCGTAVDGSVVYGQVQGEPARFQADPALLEKALAVNGTLPAGGPKIHPGLIVTGDWFVDSQEKMREIIGHFPEALAVDMESAAIAHACRRFGVPFISFRTISDMPLSDNKASQYHDFWAQIADSSFSITHTFIDSINS